MDSLETYAWLFRGVPRQSPEVARVIADGEVWSDFADLGDQPVVFRVRIDGLPKERLYPGRDDEAEYLIEGMVEAVSISEDDDE